MKKRKQLEAYVKERFGTDLHKFVEDKVEKESLYDREIGEILSVERGYVAKLRFSFGINRANGFSKRFERKYGPGAEETFRTMIENPDVSLSDLGRFFGFSREYARQVYRKIYGFPYTETHRRKREERKRKREVKDHLEPDRLAIRWWSIQRGIDRRFRGPGGINCRSRLAATNTVSLEINQLISDRLAGATDSPLRTRGPHTEPFKAIEPPNHLTRSGKSQ